MTVEQLHQLKTEANDLAQKLRTIFLGQAIPIAQKNPFANSDFGKLRHAIDRAEARAERRTERWADAKWPNRVKR